MIIGFRMGPLKAGDGGGVLDSISSCSEASSAASSDSDLTDEATSSSSSSSPPPSSSASVGDPLRDMSSLMEQLPIKRGLSRYFQGKSQSFTSLSNVRSLEDLAKPENPYNKRLKSCRSYAGLADSHSSSSSSGLLPRTSSSSRFNPKKTSTSSSRVSCSSSSAKRNSNGSFARPPMAAPPPPHRSASASSFNSNQTPLFA